MEFDDHDHDDEEEQEEEDDEEEINLPQPQAYDSVPHPRIGGVGPPHTSSGRKIPVAAWTKYKECLKNHAVKIGGYATDGCGEFMPAGEEGTLDSLRCAACGCHRNFHRNESDGVGGDHHPLVSASAAAAAVGGGVAGVGGVGALYQPLPPYGYHNVSVPSPAGAHQHLHRPLALPSPSDGTHSREEMEDMSHPSSSGGGGGGGSMGKKRFRTKFSREQKDRMLEFAEKLGWRMQKQDEAAVQQFCQEVQVKRRVLKVWMHNNKHTLGKKA